MLGHSHSVLVGDDALLAFAKTAAVNVCALIHVYTQVFLSPFCGVGIELRASCLLGPLCFLVFLLENPWVERI
jgi:hypothetical protein